MKLVDFDYAIVRWVPSVCRGEYRNVGVVLHAPTEQYLCAVVSKPADAPARVWRYLESLEAIARGDAEAGPLAQLGRSERFHWLTAPRSDSIQLSPCHAGRAPHGELEAALQHIFTHAVSRENNHE